MKRLLTLSLLILIGLLVITACNEQSPPTAATTVRTAFDAYHAANTDRLAAQFCDSGLASLTFPITDAPPRRFAELQYTQQDTNDHHVQVLVSGRLEDDPPDSVANTIRWLVDLQHSHGRWCIAAIARLPAE